VTSPTNEESWRFNFNYSIFGGEFVHSKLTHMYVAQRQSFWYVLPCFAVLSVLELFEYLEEWFFAIVHFFKRQMRSCLAVFGQVWNSQVRASNLNYEGILVPSRLDPGTFRSVEEIVNAVRFEHRNFWCSNRSVVSIYIAEPKVPGSNLTVDQKSRHDWVLYQELWVSCTADWLMFLLLIRKK